MLLPMYRIGSPQRDSMRDNVVVSASMQGGDICTVVHFLIEGIEEKPFEIKRCSTSSEGPDEPIVGEA